jgi:hypothetical protein
VQLELAIAMSDSSNTVLACTCGHPDDDDDDDEQLFWDRALITDQALMAQIQDLHKRTGAY